MRVVAFKTCFIEGYRRRPGQEFTLKDEKNFNARCMVSKGEPLPEDPQHEQIFTNKMVEHDEDPRPQAKAKSKSRGKSGAPTGDQDVLGG